MYTPRTTLRRTSPLPFVSAAAAALIAATGAGVSWWRHRSAASFEPLPPVPPASSADAAAPATQPLSVSSVPVQSLLEAISPGAVFRHWVRHGDAVRRWVVLTNNIAEGASPRAQLGFVHLRRRFSAVSRGATTIVSPASYARYDTFANVVAAIDARAVATAYRELYPVLERAYRALGYPGASLDAVTTRALRRIEAAPVVDAEVAVVPQGPLFEFADERLRAMGAVEKHLLRMGPRNTRILQAKARDIEEALGLSGRARVAAHG